MRALSMCVGRPSALPFVNDGWLDAWRVCSRIRTDHAIRVLSVAAPVARAVCSCLLVIPCPFRRVLGSMGWLLRPVFCFVSQSGAQRSSVRLAAPIPGVRRNRGGGGPPTSE